MLDGKAMMLDSAMALSSFTSALFLSDVGRRVELMVPWDKRGPFLAAANRIASSALPLPSAEREL